MLDKESMDGNTAPVISEARPSVSMDDLKELRLSLEARMEDMFSKIMDKLNNPTSAIAPSIVAPVVNTNVEGFDASMELTPKIGVPQETCEGTSSPKEKSGPGDNSTVPPPSNYTPDPPISMPHIVPQGPPPMLDASSFVNWQFLMKSHLSSSSIEL